MRARLLDESFSGGLSVFIAHFNRRAAIAAAVIALLAACSGNASSPVMPGTQTASAVRPNSVVPTSAPSTTPSPAPTATPCAGDLDDCVPYRFILPLSAHETKESLALTVASEFGLYCIAFGPQEAPAFTEGDRETLTLAKSYTQPDYCAFFENIGFDSAHRMAVATPAPTSTPTATSTPAPTPTPSAAPGHGLYIVQVAVACSAGERGDSRIRASGHHGDGDDHGCNATPNNTTVTALAGPGQRDGDGHITFPALAAATTVVPQVNYYYFVAKYTGSGTPPAP